jgi:hypothetical protein
MTEYDIVVSIDARVNWITPSGDRPEFCRRMDIQNAVRARAAAFEKELRSILMADLGVIVPNPNRDE